jgi:ATP-dependent protease ClpP protease subunit
MLLYITIDMEYLLYFLFMCVYLSNCGIVCENTPSIHFTHNNFILVKNAIDEEVANRFIYELNQMSSKENVTVYLDTNGGSVEHGNKMLNEIQKYNLSCVAERAYSMGFVLLQGCNKRYITPYGRIMQHQISYGVQNEKGKIDSYVNFIDQIEDELANMQASKINMSVESFRLKTMNDWWLIGNNAVKNNCVDNIINVYCDAKLTKMNYTKSFGPYHQVYSRCPLVSEPIDYFITSAKI